jgi:hypothetical protein
VKSVCKSDSVIKVKRHSRSLYLGGTYFESPVGYLLPILRFFVIFHMRIFRQCLETGQDILIPDSYVLTVRNHHPIS